MRILVTGGTGFTGSALSLRLLEEGHAVRVLDNQPGLFDGLLGSSGAEVHLGSVTDATLVRRLTRGCERVFHLAAAFRKVNLSRAAYHATNVGGTRLLMEAALGEGVERFVYCSTCGVHGDVKRPPAAEDAPVDPADYYQRTKWEGELVAREFLGRGLWTSIVRPAAIYGPGDPGRFLLLFRRVRTGTFIFFGPGTAFYHPVYIDNLVDGLCLAAERDGARGQAYLIADARYLSIRELVLEIASVLGVPLRIRHLPFLPAYALGAVVETAYKPLPFEPPIFRRRLDWFRQNRAFDIGKARRELGYTPRVDLRAGLEKTAEWYRAQGYLPAA